MNIFNNSKAIFTLFLFIIFFSCQQDKSTSDNSISKIPEIQKHSPQQLDQKRNGLKLFKKLSLSESGISFKNEIKENDVLNYFSYEYIYNGGGVAIGDLNNDNLPDLFFTANMKYNKLYINKGNLEFQDISNHAGIQTKGDWCTGVTMVDINNDGWLDIYVSRSGWFGNTDLRRNLLFINNGDLTFTEQASSYGIDDPGYTSQVTFFDFDRDNDLDLYVGNHPINFKENLIEGMKRRKNPPLYQSDQLYRNDGGKFTNISKQAGISNYGYALGVMASDLDNDGWTDIFVSNDFAAPNYYYRNKGDGTFENIGAKMFKHSSRFSMGADIADINNDGRYDIYTTEMMAEDNRRQKTNMASMSTELFWTFIKENYGYQYMHNSLQLNQGDAPFSEIAYLAGVATTDWSWSPLLVDFDNDGYKDIFVSNGFKRDVLDKDFNIQKGYEVKQNPSAFSKIKDHIPVTKLSNYIYQNNHNLTFKNQSKDWGFSDAMNTNGASYADLDNDGDLDLVLNNMDEPSVIYKNQLMELSNKKSNYLKIKFEGPPNNRNGIGTRISIKNGTQEQHHELLETRGYQSSVEPVLHIGLGAIESIDELKVLWPDGREQIIKNVDTGQILSIKYKNSKKGGINKNKVSPFFSSAKNYLKGIRPHKEKEFNDYSKQLLLPHKQSQFGPSIAVGDLNGDGMEDLFLGGAAEQAGLIAFQQKNGSFLPQKSSALEKDLKTEDMGSLFFDADGDGDLDLYVTSGSYEFKEKNPLLQDRLYLNDGSGEFVKKTSALPKLLSNGSCVIAGDYDNDNDLDLFVGGLSKHGKYPLSDDSYILKNVGGKFKIANNEVFSSPPKGLVKSALWTDYDNDNDLDLIVTGEWMQIKIYNNENGKLEEVTRNLGLNKSSGWWNSISSGDFDNDGDIDYILGNLGLNSKYKATYDSPFMIFANDFDKNGTFDVALGFYEDGIRYPLRGMQCSSEQVPSIAQKIPNYASFAIASIEDVYGAQELRSAINLEAFQFASCFMENKGDDGFILHPLPNEAQIAPIYGTLVQDFDRDGCLDALLVGNQFPIEVETTRQDAHRGVLLKGNCENNFTAVSIPETGLEIVGDAKAMAWISHTKSKKPLIIVTQNDDKVISFSLNRLDKNLGFRLEPPDPNKSNNSEGSGYLSQSSNKIWAYKR
jgi:hypothetical protein